ncbi:MAG: hypothetical protein VB824_10420 [Dehalococcoidia bacterium]
MNRRRLSACATLLVAVVLAAMVWGSSTTHAQGPPSLGFTLYQGSVTVAGLPAEDGSEIRARIPNMGYESTVVATAGGRYNALQVGPVPGASGQELEFVLGDQVVAITVDNYDAPNCSSEACPTSRVFNLSFVSAPVPPTPVPSLPARYSGYVSADGAIPSDSAPFTVRIGTDYEVTGGTLNGGDFSIIVDPKNGALSGETVEFFLYDVKAPQTSTYQAGAIVSDLWLTFAGVPIPTAVPEVLPTATAIPEPTPEPAPEPTPEPTSMPMVAATATSMPQPTSVPTPEPTPIPTAAPVPTSTPVVMTGFDVDELSEAVAEEVARDDVGKEFEESGGMCAANPGGPASGGQLGLILAPLGLALWLGIRRHGMGSAE